MAVDFAASCPLVRLGRPRYPVRVPRVAALLHASFRPRLAATPLRFANPSPPSGWVEDLHLQAAGHARHTRKGPARRRDQGGRLLHAAVPKIIHDAVELGWAIVPGAFPGLEFGAGNGRIVDPVLAPPCRALDEGEMARDHVGSLLGVLAHQRGERLGQLAIELRCGCDEPTRLTLG